MNKLTDKQQAFVAAKAQGLNGTEAARMAGYAVPKQEASRLLQVPAIQNALRLEREALISGRLAPKALTALEWILDDPDCQATAKVRAATWILEAAGHGLEAWKARKGHVSLDEKPLHEMSLAELKEIARKLRETEYQLEHATPIEVEAQGGESSESR